MEEGGRVARKDDKRRAVARSLIYNCQKNGKLLAVAMSSPVLLEDTGYLVGVLGILFYIPLVNIRREVHLLLYVLKYLLCPLVTVRVFVSIMLAQSVGCINVLSQALIRYQRPKVVPSVGFLYL